MLEQTVRVFAEPAVRRAPRRLHVGDIPGRGSEHPEERLGMHRARAHFDVERLLEETALRRPVVRQLANEILKSHGSGLSSFTTRADRSSFSRWSAISV